MKRIEPSVNILHKRNYTPSFLMTWKRTLIPVLHGQYGLQGKYRNQMSEGTKKL